jgi:NADH-quinone oxidoreductase subunit I
MTPEAREQRNPLVAYFADIWLGITSICSGMALTFRYLMSKPITMEYPEERPIIPPTYRGKHAYDEEKCTLCKQCANACPAGCIRIVTEGKGANQLATDFSIDYAHCLFCNFCQEACKPEALELTGEYNIISTTREGVEHQFARPKTEAELQALRELIAQKEAAKAAAKAAKAAKAAEEKKASSGDAPKEEPEG